MNRIGTCPRCMQPVSVPAGLAPDCLVRCPTCEGEYPLRNVSVESEEEAGSDGRSPLDLLQQQAYGTDQPPSPPELIPVAISPEQPSELPPVADQPSDRAEEPIPPAEQPQTDTEQPSESPEEEPALLLEEEKLLEQPQEEGFAPEAETRASDQEISSIEAEVPIELATSEQLESSPPPPLPFQSASAEGAQAVESGQPAELPPAEIVGQPAQGPVPSPTLEPLASIEAPASEEAASATALSTAGSEEAPAAPYPSEAAEASLAEPPEAELAPETPAEEAPTIDLDPLVRAPFSEESFPLSELIVASTGERIGPVAAAMIVRHGLLRPLTEEEAAAMAPPEPATAQEPAETFDFSQLAAASQEGAPAEPISVRTRRRPEVHPLKEMFGIVLGGLAGLLIGYYLLNIFGGARYDFLKIYLPGVKHTYKYAPSWLPSWIKGGASPAQSEEQSVPGPSSQNAQKKNNKVPVGPTSKSSAHPSPPAGKSMAGPGQQTTHQKHPISPPPKPSPSTPPPNAKGKSSNKSPPPAEQTKLPLIGAPSYTAQELGQALQGVLEVFGCKHCNSTGKQTKTIIKEQNIPGQPKQISRQVSVVCPVCKGTPPKRINEESFDRFCHLGEVLCFVRGPEEKNFLQDRRLAARNLLLQAAKEPNNPEKIGLLAAARWEDAARLSMGLLAAGKLEPSQQEGAWQKYQLQLASTKQKIPLVLQRPPPANAADMVLVLGAIVEDPAETLPGYSGKESAILLGVQVVQAP